MPYIYLCSRISVNLKVRCDWWSSTFRKSIFSERCKPLSALWAFHGNKTTSLPGTIESSIYNHLTSCQNVRWSPRTSRGGVTPQSSSSLPLSLMPAFPHHTRHFPPLPPVRSPSCLPLTIPPTPRQRIHYNGTHANSWTRGPAVMRWISQRVLHVVQYVYVMRMRRLRIEVVQGPKKSFQTQTWSA